MAAEQRHWEATLTQEAKWMIWAGSNSINMSLKGWIEIKMITFWLNFYFMSVPFECQEATTMLLGGHSTL